MAGSEKRDAAYALHKEGKTPSEIAAALEIPVGTVRGWKSKFGWEKKAPRNAPRNGTKSGTLARRSGRSAPPAKSSAAKAGKGTGLSDAEELFCAHYAKSFNATAAYLASHPNCTYGTARTEGSRLFAKPDVKKEIGRLKKAVAKSLLAGAANVLEKMMHIAFADMADYVEWGAEVEPVRDKLGFPLYAEVCGSDGEMEQVPLTRVVNRVVFKDSNQVDGTLISEVRQGRDGVSVKLADRMAALKWLAEYFEMNPADRHRRDYDKRVLEMKAAGMELLHSGAQEGGDIVLKILPASRAEKEPEEE